MKNNHIDDRLINHLENILNLIQDQIQTVLREFTPKISPPYTTTTVDILEPTLQHWYCDELFFDRWLAASAPQLSPS
jgi:hypothetical protein